MKSIKLRLVRRGGWDVIVSHLFLHAYRYWRRLRFEANVPQLFCIPNDAIGEQITVNGLYERDELVAIDRFLERFAARSCVVVIDVGANIGNHAVFFASRGLRVLAFEPNPLALAALRANVLLNGAQDSVTVFEFGLSNLDGSLPFRIDRSGNLGASRFVEADRECAPEYLLSVFRGDAILNDLLQDGQFILVKLDVEGHERHVLEGMPRLLERFRPIVAFEHVGLAAIDASNRIKSLLVGLGYRRFLALRRRPTGVRGGVLMAIVRLVVGADMYAEEISEFDERIYPLVLAVHSEFEGCMSAA